MRGARRVPGRGSAVVVLVLAACGGPETPEPDAVVAAERAFSATSVAEGTRAAFLQWFAPDAVSFGPGPLRGTDHIAEWPPDGPILEWAPELAEVSADGRMGYTLGPYRQSLPDGGTAWGHYHSVWRQNDAGEWRVALDIGTRHGPVPWPPGSVATPASAVPSATGDDGLLERDRAYATTYASQGQEVAMRGFVAERARVSRTGAVPWRGRAAALAALDEAAEALTWTPAGAGVADSGDLGYTWGSGTFATGPMSYARFWRREPGGEWQVVVEVVASHPPPPPSGG